MCMCVYIYIMYTIYIYIVYLERSGDGNLLADILKSQCPSKLLFTQEIVIDIGEPGGHSQKSVP